jgi:hypothetical protein
MRRARALSTAALPSSPHITKGREMATMMAVKIATNIAVPIRHAPTSSICRPYFDPYFDPSTPGSTGFSNADITFTPFSAQNGLFSADINFDRQWNGTVTYDLGNTAATVPEPSTLGLSLLFLGAGAALRRRMK